MIKLFLIALLGSYPGNSLMLPSATYSFESGIQMKGIRLGLDIGYLSQSTKYPDFEIGSASLIPIMASLTIVPPIKSRVKPFVGIGYGYIIANRQLSNQTRIVGWRDSESLNNGYAYMLKGGFEIAMNRRVALVLGVKQIIYDTQLIHMRTQNPKFEDSIIYRTSTNINLNSISGNLGVRIIF